MSRNVLILWRWSEAQDSEGYAHFDSIGGQMKAIKKKDRFFVCATSADELYLLGMLEVRKVEKERNRNAREKFGKYRAICRNLSGKFKKLALDNKKWRLRFLSKKSDRLNPGKTLGFQLQAHRFLTDDSADLLAGMLGEDLASAERQRRERLFIEGERRAIRSFRVVRSPSLRLDAKQRWGTRCYCCGFDFEEFYGEIGSKFTIIHHLHPLGGYGNQVRKTSVEEVRVVCANCHYILHREDPPLEVDQLKRQIARKWTPWSSKGIRAR